MTLVVASLVEGGIAGASGSSREAFAKGADAVEIRLDLIKGLRLEDLAKVKREVNGPAIATLRSAKEGGGSRLSRQARATMLREAARLGFHGLDLEVGSDRDILLDLKGQRSRPLLIASAHLKHPVSSEEFERTLEVACSLGDIGKVAMPCEHACHALMLAEVGMSMSRKSSRFVAIGVGTQGQLTRVCARELGSAMVYACLPERPAAPGQVDVALQRALLEGEKNVFGLVGHLVSHSVSKPMQEAALSKLGMVGTYLPLDFPPGSFDMKALRQLRSLGFRGLNVTIPHKAAAFQLCSRKSAAALSTGAVNTITFEDSESVGENTDVIGFSRLLDGKMRISPKTSCMVLGAGGAARAVVHVLRGRGATVTVADVEGDRAEELARLFGVHSIPPGGLWEAKGRFDLIVNCTPVGMEGVPGNPFKRNIFRRGSVFLDIVFNPLETEAMKMAKGAGAKVFGGLEMLVQQGAESFRIWTGKEPDVAAMRKAAKEALE